MIHRAIYGSFERFIGILIEHYAGNFPVWLAPEQARILPVVDRHHEYALSVAEEMRAAGLRADVDLSNNKLGAKMREAQVAKIPYGLVVGDKEVADHVVTPRKHGEKKDEGITPLAGFIERLRREGEIPF